MPALLRPARIFSALVVITILAACKNDVPTAPRVALRGADHFKVAVPSAFSHVSAGAFHTCALRVTGVVECWGDNSQGQAPGTKAAATGMFTAVTAGDAHTCALRTDAVIQCWGDNSAGQAPATKTASSSSFTQVSAGSRYTCARRADGAVECWGADPFGNAPAIRTASTGTFTGVTAGLYHTCALRTDAVIECWGDNTSGQAPATKAAASGTFTQVSARELHTCGRRSDGVVECWGLNSSGEAPTTVTAATGTFTQVSAGRFHSCGLRTDSKVQCWGNDPIIAPAVKTAATGTFTELSAGDFHNCAIRSDGAVECWGSNSNGQAESRVPGTTVDVFATADFNTSGPVVVGQSFTLSFTNAHVPGHPEATNFRYAFDCGDGNGFGPVSSTSTATCPTSAAGTRNVRGQLIDQDDVNITYFGTVEVLPPPDVTPPVISATVSGTAGTNGWYTSNVTVSWTVIDGESAITSPTCDAVTISTDTQGQTVTCSATSTGGTDSKSVTIKRDATAPVLSPTVSPTTVLLNGTAAAAAHASDITSGLGTSSCAPVVASSVGNKTVMCTATDLAGNTASAAATYTVTYGFSGFGSPLDDDGVLNIARAGQTIALKWRLLDAAGKPVATVTNVTVNVATLNCGSGTSTSALEEYASGGSGLQNLGNGYYQFNWKSPKNYSGSCKTLHLDLGEGITRTVLFQFK